MTTRLKEDRLRRCGSIHCFEHGENKGRNNLRPTVSLRVCNYDVIAHVAVNVCRASGCTFNQLFVNAINMAVKNFHPPPGSGPAS